MEPASSLPYT